MWPNTMKWVALRIWEKWEKGKSSIHDVPVYILSK
jgi:hypothetical protein